MFPIHPTLRIALPPDFPADDFLKVQKLARRFQSDDGQAIARHRQFRMAWNAVAYRFRLGAEADEALSALIRGHGTSPSHDDHVQRANHLFVFFLAGQASVESLVFAAHAMPAALGSPGIRIDSVEDRKKVKFDKKTLDALDAAVPGTRLLGALRALMLDPAYVRWQGLRNLLDHQISPGMTAHASFGSDPQPPRYLYERIETPGRKAKDHPGLSADIPNQVDDIVIDENMTAESRKWLAAKLTDLVGGTVELAERVFGGLPDRV
jgi:hypothetical protein